MATPVYRMPSEDRWQGVEPFIGQRCRVTFRTGGYMPFDRTVVGTVLGAAAHLTNGNSTGDLIMHADPGSFWRVGAGKHRVVSIALSNLGSIDPEPQGQG